MSLEDRMDALEDSVEGKMDILLERVDDLEAQLEQTDYQVGDMNSEFVIFRSKSAGEIERIKQVLALATSPDPADLNKYKQLREAYDKYMFTRQLVIGDVDKI